MGKKWTSEEDAFLLHYHNIPGGPDFIASHDLGRPYGAGTRRMKILNKSGARVAFAEMRILEMTFEIACGRGGFYHGSERKALMAELADAIAAKEH